MIRNPIGVNTLPDLIQRVWDIWRYLNPLVTPTTTDYTTDKRAGLEIILADSTATGTQTITLHSGAADLQTRVVRKNPSHGGTVTTATEGSETIDGSGTDSVTSTTEYQWLEKASEWVKRG